MIFTIIFHIVNVPTAARWCLEARRERVSEIRPNLRTEAMMQGWAVQNNVDIIAGIEVTQSEAITTNVFVFWLVVFLAVSE